MRGAPQDTQDAVIPESQHQSWIPITPTLLERGNIMTDLVALQTEIESIGTQIRELKSSGGGDVGALVAQLNTLKKQYADNNGGMGVDGKPYQPPSLSKAEKKKLEKEQKAAAAAAAPVTVRGLETMLQGMTEGPSCGVYGG
jgi:hypothetical protein